MSMNKTVNLKVNGIHCGGCAGKIKNSVAELGIEHQTEVDVATGNVKVQFDGTKASVSDIKSKITAVGFQVESVQLE